MFQSHRLFASLLAVGAVAFLAGWLPPSAAAADPDPAAPTSLAGKVVSVDAAGVVIADAAGSQTTVTTNGSTKVTVDGKTASQANLQAGMSVQVQLAGGVATFIIAKSQPAVTGTIVSVDADGQPGKVVVATVAAPPSVGLPTPAKPAPAATAAGAAKPAKTGAKDETMDTLADKLTTVLPGGLIVNGDSGRIAKPVTPAPGGAAGAAGSGGLNLKSNQVTIATTAGTVVNIMGQARSLADLAAGMPVVVKLAAVGGPATEIDVKSQPLSGTVVSVDQAGLTVVVQPPDPKAAQVTFAAAASTVVNIAAAAKPGTLASLAAGMPVVVKFAKAGGPASEIDARPGPTTTPKPAAPAAPATPAPAPAQPPPGSPASPPPADAPSLLTPPL